MTKRSLILLGVAMAGLIGWVGAYFAYFNWFPEGGSSTGRDLVGLGMWTSAFVGLVATLAFGWSIWRTPRA